MVLWYINICDIVDGAERRFRVTDQAAVLQTAEGITVSLVKGSIVSQKVC